ncbi:hypothetical protein ERJ75_001228200 [Trypanosoma vivax]|nr:hypothetical protein ERJ75_001228200 [Trypanosoma vivax]
MRRSAKGVDALNEAVTVGIRMAAKRTAPKGKGVGPPFWTLELTKLDKMVQECKNERKRDALIRWRRKVLADTALGQWTENVSKFSATDSASWNLPKSICAPRPLTLPVLVVDGHPLTTRQQAQALVNMHMARPTKAPHGPEMKIHGTRRSTFRPITEAELGVVLRELSSGTAPGDDEIHCEELKQLGRLSRRCILRLFNYSLCTGQVPDKWRHGIIVPLPKPNMPASSMVSFRPVMLRAVVSPEWGPEREKQRAFCPALVQAKVCNAIALCRFVASLPDRERPESNGALPAPEGKRPDAREGRGKHFPTPAPSKRQAGGGTTLVQRHWRRGKAARCDGVAASKCISNSITHQALKNDREPRRMHADKRCRALSSLGSSNAQRNCRANLRLASVCLLQKSFREAITLMAYLATSCPHNRLIALCPSSAHTPTFVASQSFC